MGLDQQLRAFERLELVLWLEVLAVDSSTSHHVVLEDGIQLFDVRGFQQPLELVRRDLGKRFVCWGEHSEGAFAFQSGNQLACFEGIHKRGEILVAYSQLDNILRWRRPGRSRRSRLLGGNENCV